MRTIRDSHPTTDGVENRPAENVNAVLAMQARERTPLELWAGALVGATNAVVIWTRFPSLHWLAAGFAATASYGLWGLIDRKLSSLIESPDNSALSRALARASRVLAGTSGWVWALYAIGAFLTAALGTFGLPGT